MTTRASRGSSTEMSLRLCSLAPETVMRSWVVIGPFDCREANGCSPLPSPVSARNQRRLREGMPLAGGAGEVALAGAHGDVASLAEITHDDGAARDLGQGAIAAIDGLPDRPAHRG